MVGYLYGQNNQNYVFIAKSQGVDSAIQLIDEAIQLNSKNSEKHLNLCYEKYKVYTATDKSHLAFKEIEHILSNDFTLSKEQKVKYAIKKYNTLNALDKQEQALATLLKTKQELSEDTDKILFAKIDRSIGIFYSKLHEFDNAKPYLTTSLKTYSAINDTNGRINVLMSLGNCYKESDQLDSALYCYETSMELAKKARKQRGVAGNLNNIANVYRRQNKMKEAIELLQEAVKINAFTGNRLWEAYNYNNIGNTYADIGEHKKAIEYYHKSIAVKKELKEDFSLIETYASLSKELAAIKDFQNAYQYALKEKELRKELKKLDIEKALANLEAKYKYGIEIDEDSTPEIMHSNSRNLEPRADEKSSNLWFWTTVILGVITIILLLISLKNKGSK